VNVQKTVWSSIGLISFFYLVPGIILALGFATESDNILTVLLQQGLPRSFTKLTVYLFAFAMLLPAIPVNLIISRENLSQNKVVSDRIANLLCFFVPWLICIPLQTGNWLTPFQTWTSSIFVSCSNFIIPVLIYFKCKVFRHQYNADRILSIKQLELLKQIHHQSNRIVNHIGRKKEALGKTNDSVEPNHKTDTVEMVELNPIVVNQDSPAPNQETSAMEWIDDDVPDPDMEDYIKTMTSPRKSTLFERFTTIARNSNLTPPVEPQNEAIASTKSPSLHRKPSQVSVQTHTEENSEQPHPTFLSVDPNEKNANNEESRYLQVTPTLNRNSTVGTMVRTMDRVSSVYTIDRKSAIRTIDRPFLDPAAGLDQVRTIDRPFVDHGTLDSVANPDALTRLGRFKTLPAHPHFRTPAFRSVPEWMPLRGVHMAWIVLLITSVVTIGNIIVNLVPVKV
jgi:hypothetical protein